MAGKATQLPLRGYYNVNKTPIITCGEKYHYACLTLNVGSKDGVYDFAENEFTFTALTATGYVNGESKWLLATVPADENGKLFKLEVKPDWKQIDKGLTDEAIKLWESSGRLIAIDVSNIPILGVMAEVLAARKLLVGGKLKANLKWDVSKKEEIISHLNTLFDFLHENKRVPMQADPEVTSIATVSQLTGYPKPFMDHPSYQLPLVDEILPEGYPSGLMVPMSVPFNGEFPDIESFIFTAPEAPAKKSGGWSSGSTVNIEGYKPQIAFAWIQENYDQVSEFFKQKVPGINDMSVSQIVLSLSGVNAVPEISIWKPKQEYKNGNGKTELFRTLPDTVEEYTEKTGVDVHIADFTTAVESKPLVDLNKKSLESHFNALSYKFDTWSNVHKDPKDHELMLNILESKLFLLHRNTVEEWVGKQFNMDQPLKPVSLDSAKLQELYNWCMTFENAHSIDQSITPVMP